jgi:hypothetical protein
MYETYGLRSEDFRTQWPHQLKVLLVVSAEIQGRAKLLHEFSVAHTQTATRDFDTARASLEKETARMVESVRDTHVQSRKDLLDASENLVKMFRRFLRDHAEHIAKLQARTDEFARQERAFQDERERFKSMPIWRRVWRAIFTGSL